MRRAVLLLSVLAVLLASGVAVAAVVAEDQPVAPTPVERAHRYWKAGPSAVYDGDSGGIGGVHPLLLELPEGTWDVVVEVSLQYRTRGDGPFSMGVGIREPDFGPRVEVRPGRLTLAAAPEGAVATGRFLAQHVAGATTYEVAPGVNSVFTDNAIRSRKVLLTVELTRSAVAG